MIIQTTKCDWCHAEKTHNENGWWKLVVCIPSGSNPLYYLVTQTEIPQIRNLVANISDVTVQDICSEQCLQRAEGQLREVMTHA